MKMTWRWYGEGNDQIKLSDIKQIPRVEGIGREQSRMTKLEALEALRRQALKDLDPCDILINGAGGSSPRATTDNEYQHEYQDGQKGFFGLDTGGVDFVSH